MLSQYGYTEAEALQLNLLDLWPASEREKVRTAVQATASRQPDMCPHCACSCARTAACLRGSDCRAASASTASPARQVLAVDVTRTPAGRTRDCAHGPAQKLLSACNETLVPCDV